MTTLRSLAFAALAALAPTTASAVTVLADDQVVQGSLCVGLACVDGEPFGFDTIRLKGTVVRVQFDDTSVSAGFPATDWQITLNDDDASGTSNHFSIEDTTAATVPFTIEAGAPTNSLRVAADGRVGLGTAAPEPGYVLDVIGDARIEGNLDVTGTTTVTAGVKAGIVAASAFVDGQSTVTFATPYAGDYTIFLTALGDAPNRRFKPAVVAQDANGFTVSAGKKSTKHLVEIQWIAQAVGE
jgi:hypothetical protein